MKLKRITLVPEQRLRLQTARGRSVETTLSTGYWQSNMSSSAIYILKFLVEQVHEETISIRIPHQPFIETAIHRRPAQRL